jgi:hypothetical protein
MYEQISSLETTDYSTLIDIKQDLIDITQTLSHSLEASEQWPEPPEQLSEQLSSQLPESFEQLEQSSEPSEQLPKPPVRHIAILDHGSAHELSTTDHSDDEVVVKIKRKYKFGRKFKMSKYSSKTSSKGSNKHHTHKK